MIEKRDIRGSILIWTLLLGVSLASVFLFFSQSLNSHALHEKETVEYLNAKRFIESYADYIEQLPTVTLNDLRNSGSGLDYGRVTGTVTNIADEIVGVLDAGESLKYEYSINNAGTDNIRIEWDECFADDAEYLELDTSTFNIVSDSACLSPSPGVDYNEIREVKDSNQVTLTAPFAPTKYKLTPNGGATLYDTHWHLDIEISLGFRNNIKVTRDFVALP